MNVRYTSDAAVMRCVHAYNQATQRRTDVQVASPEWAGAWMGAVLVSTWGDVWHVTDASGRMHYVAPKCVRIPQA